MKAAPEKKRVFLDRSKVNIHTVTHFEDTTSEAKELKSLI